MCESSLVPHWTSVVDPDSGEAFAIKICPRCKLKVTDPLPEDPARYYSPTYFEGRHGFTTSLCNQRRFRLVDSLFREKVGRKWLDVGCGDGTLLELAHGKGWKVCGVDPFSRVSTKDIAVFRDLEEAAQQGPFDVITLWHVLEHLTEPSRDLETIRRMLNSDGKLIIAIPDVESRQALKFGPDWMHLDVPRHFWHFSETSLKRLVHAHGLDVERIKMSEWEYDLMGWTQSKLHQWGLERNGFYKAVVGRFEGTRLRKWTNLLLGILFSLSAAIPVIAAGRLGRGAVLILLVRHSSEYVEKRNV